MGIHRVPVVYLAGGMRTNWQDRVKVGIKELGLSAIFIDPREHGLREESAYTSWDLEGIRHANIVFAYLEADNPSGAGLALEIGFAAALNEAPQSSRKHIIFVCDPFHPCVRYFGMARACADVVTRTLAKGIDALARELEMYQPPRKRPLRKVIISRAA